MRIRPSRITALVRTLLLMASSAGAFAPIAAAGAPLRVAIYADGGASGETLLPLARAVALGGHQPLTVTAEDLAAGLLDTTLFDVFVLPEGREGSPDGYDAELGQAGLDAVIRAFVDAGGGFLGLGAGARYASADETWNGVDRQRSLALWSGSAVGPLDGLAQGLGRVQIDPGWSAGHRAGNSRSVFVGPGAAFFVPRDAGEVLARWQTGRAADAEEGAPSIVRFVHGAGRGVLLAPLPAVDVRSEGDWSAWDDRIGRSCDGEHDAGLLLSLLEWAAGDGDRRPPSLLPASATGPRVAVYTTRTAAGGAFPALLTAVARAVEYAGMHPLALRAEEIHSAELDRSRYDLLVMPGGWAAGYAVQLAGGEGVIRGFCAGGGGYLGISAGAFYAADHVLWQSQNYDYPLDLFDGTLEGPLDEIAPWPSHVLTPLLIDDPLFGHGLYSTWYQGEGLFRPSAAAPEPVTVSGRYDAPGPHRGSAAVVRHLYGAGRVIYPNLHLEVEEGSDRDWMFTGDQDAGGPLSDPESEWDLLAAMLDWALPAAPAAAPVRPSVAIPLLFGGLDTTSEALAEIQSDGAQGPAPATPVRGDGRLTLSPGETLHLAGFGVKPRLALPRAVLEAEYSAPADYGGGSAIEWRTGGGAWHDSGLVPRAGRSDELLSFDLGAAGVSTVEAIASLELRFSCAASGGSCPSFDWMRVGLADDRDADGAPDAFDCAPADGGSFAVPDEPRLPAPPGDLFEWQDQTVSAGEGTVSEVTIGLVSQLRADRGFDRSTCRREHVSESSLPPPPTGDARYLTVRAVNGCPGSLPPSCP